MKIISIRENPQYSEIAIQYFQKIWANEKSMNVYRDCIEHCQGPSVLPQWYLLMNDHQIIGCAGLVTNDFISRMDLYPYFVALYIEEDYRGHHYGKLLMDKGILDTKNAGFLKMYLITDLIGYYEKYGFEKIGVGYHPWGETSMIYGISVNQ